MNNIEKTLIVLGTTAVLSGCFGGEYADAQTPAPDVPDAELPGGDKPVAGNADITLDFKADTKTYLTPGDSNGSATVGAGPLDATNEALKVVVASGYDAGVAMPITIPAGKTLADYTSVSFKVYYTAEGSADTDYKRIQVIASSGDLPDTVTLIKYDGTWADNATSGHLGVMVNGKEDKLESTAFQTYTFDLTDGNVADLLPDTANSLDAAAKALTGDINLIVGFSHSDSTYYIDDVVLVAAESDEEEAPNPLLLNFESKTIGDELLSTGWSTDEVTAVVADDIVNSGNKVMSVTSTNYNTAAVVSFDLPADTTLADYSTITYKAYYASGDVGYKVNKIFAYDTAPATGVDYDEANSTAIGSFNRELDASTDWETISIDITNTSTLAGTVYLSIGSNNSGAVIYYDDITLVK